MKERVCMTKRCPLRRIHKETKELFCTVGENAEGFYLEKVVGVSETSCMSRRMEARRAGK